MNWVTQAGARELVGRGFAADVALCVDENASTTAARLEGDCFVADTSSAVGA